MIIHLAVISQHKVKAIHLCYLIWHTQLYFFVVSDYSTDKVFKESLLYEGILEP